MIYLDNNTETQRVYIPRTNIDANAYHPSTGGTERYYAGTNIEITQQNVINVTGLTEAIESTVTGMTLNYATTGDVETMISAATVDFVTSGDVESQITAATQNLVTSGDVANALTSYTPTANFATINGSGITSGGNLVIEGGGTDENAQHKYTAATEAVMEALTGISEGDICVVLGRYKQASAITTSSGYNMYDYLSWGWDLFSIMDTLGIGFRQRYRFSVIENPSYDPYQSYGDKPSGSTMVFSVTDYSLSEDKYYGVECDNDGNWNYMNGEDSQTWEEMPGSSVIIDLANVPQDNVGTSWIQADNITNMFSEYTTTSNPNYQYVFAVEIYYEAETFQYNNGSWIEVASADGVKTANDKAQQAIDAANSKLSTGTIWVYPNQDPMTELQYNQDGVYDMQIDNGGGYWDDYGLIIHRYDTTDDANNKYVKELVTSTDALKIVALTQTEYTNLSTKDAHTLYLIIPNNS